MENLNYPIGYAIEPLFPSAYSAKDHHFLLGFIVAKCFIVSELKHYYENGCFIINYQVVFPYQGINFFELERERIVPKFQYKKRNQQMVCINADHADTVFETYEDAKKLCDQLNTCFDTSRVDELQELEDLVQMASEDLVINLRKDRDYYCDKGSIASIEKMIEMKFKK